MFWRARHKEDIELMCTPLEETRPKEDIELMCSLCFRDGMMDDVLHVQLYALLYDIFFG